MLTEFYCSSLSESSLLFTDEKATFDPQSVNKDAMNLANEIHLAVNKAFNKSSDNPKQIQAKKFW